MPPFGPAIPDVEMQIFVFSFLNKLSIFSDTTFLLTAPYFDNDFFDTDKYLVLALLE